MAKNYDDYIDEMLRMHRMAMKKQSDLEQAVPIPLAQPVQPIRKPPAPAVKPDSQPKPPEPATKPDSQPKPPEPAVKPDSQPKPPAPAVRPDSQPKPPAPAVKPDSQPKPPAPVIKPDSQPKPPAPVIKPDSQPPMPAPEFIPENDIGGSGKLIVKVTAARGMLPVADADVTVSQTAENGGGQIITIVTDSSGNTPEITLPAPPKYKSESPIPPDDDETVMAKYDITVSADGYVDAVIKGVALFDGVTSIQNVDLITDSAADSGQNKE